MNEDARPEVQKQPEDVPWRVIAEALCNGNTVPFLGAGATAAHRPEKVEWSPTADFGPFAKELATYLGKKAPLPDEEGDDLTLVASFFELENGRSKLIGELEGLLAGTLKPGPIHKMLARCPNLRLVLTTNYDCLIETAFREAGVPFNVVIDTGVRGEKQFLLCQAGRSPVRRSGEQIGEEIEDLEGVIVHKMHGSLELAGSKSLAKLLEKAEPYRPDLVISTADYIAALGRGGAILPECYNSLIRDRGLLFLGYSLKDWNIRVLLPQLKSTGAVSWSFQHRRLVAEARLWMQLKVNTYGVDLAAAVERLAQELDQVQGRVPGLSGPGAAADAPNPGPDR